MIVHKCMLPPDTEGTVESVANDGEYTIDETIVTIIQNDGTKKELTKAYQAIFTETDEEA